MPSEQLTAYLTLRGSGCSVATAADESGIGEDEAWLHEEDVKAGKLKFITTGEETMPKHDEVVEVVAPDFAMMKRIFLHDLKALEENSAKVRGDQSHAWKTIEKDAHCNKKGAKFVFWLLGQSEETRDDVLRTVYGGLKACNIGISQDLVDKMNGEDAPEMPTVESRGLGAENLATVN